MASSAMPRFNFSPRIPPLDAMILQSSRRSVARRAKNLDRKVNLMAWTIPFSKKSFSAAKSTLRERKL